MDFAALIEIICFEIIVYYIIFTLFSKFDFVKVLWIFLGNVLLIPGLILLNFNSLFHLTVNIILCIFIPVLFTDNIKKSNIIAYIILIYGAYTIGEFVLAMLFMIFVDHTQITNEILYPLVMLLVLIGFHSVPFGRRKVITFVMSDMQIKVLVTTCIWLVYFLLCGTSVVLPIAKELSYVLFFGSIAILSVFAVIFLCYMLITNNLQKRHYEKINGLIEHDYNNQVRYYENMNKANEDLRKFRHDYENMKIGLFTYLENEDYKGAYAYLQQGDELVRQGSCVYNTGHAIANALLSDKAGQVAGENIKIEFHGIIPCDALTPIDLCIVLGNTLDNAIEACRRMPSDETKEIHMSVKTKKNFMFVTVTNPTYEQVSIINNRVTTTKKDKSSHGIGLYSVERVVKKYDGGLNLTYEDGLFTIELDFEIQRELLQVT